MSTQIVNNLGQPQISYSVIEEMNDIYISECCANLLAGKMVRISPKTCDYSIAKEKLSSVSQDSLRAQGHSREQVFISLDYSLIKQKIEDVFKKSITEKRLDCSLWHEEYGAGWQTTDGWCFKLL